MMDNDPRYKLGRKMTSKLPEETK